MPTADLITLLTGAPVATNGQPKAAAVDGAGFLSALGLALGGAGKTGAGTADAAASPFGAGKDESLINGAALLAGAAAFVTPPVAAPAVPAAPTGSTPAAAAAPAAAIDTAPAPLAGSATAAPPAAEAAAAAAAAPIPATPSAPQGQPAAAPADAAGESQVPIPAPQAATPATGTPTPAAGAAPSTAPAASAAAAVAAARAPASPAAGPDLTAHTTTAPAAAGQPAATQAAAASASTPTAAAAAPATSAAAAVNAAAATADGAAAAGLTLISTEQAREQVRTGAVTEAGQRRDERQARVKPSLFGAAAGQTAASAAGATSDGAKAAPTPAAAASPVVVAELPAAAPGPDELPPPVIDVAPAAPEAIEGEAAAEVARPAEAAAAAARAGLQPNIARATLETTALIAAQIVRRLEGRSTRFDMALSPEGLGRVDVQVEIDSDGRLAARLAFDNPAAATDLRGRADELRRELQDAGFTLADDALDFSDREDGSARKGFDGREEHAFRGAGRLNAETDDSAARTPGRWRALTLTPEGVDMKV